mmetsp:Transcript_53516/g.62515  ORF Transcript_53516/g.62515 Transcript_53516/m.62515 type:complete len:1327 (-) Transcript_53516:87-4067(-)
MSFFYFVVSDDRFKGMPSSAITFLNQNTCAANSISAMTSYGAVTSTSATMTAPGKENSKSSASAPSPADDDLVKKRMIENKNSERLIKEIDDRCRSVASKALLVYAILVLVSYAIGFAMGRIEKLRGIESSAPLMASVLLGISCFSTVLPLIFRVQNQDGKKFNFFSACTAAITSSKANGTDDAGGATPTDNTNTSDTDAMSGVIFTALVVQMIAFSADLMMATIPVPVFLDPVTKQRIFLLRWCEWAPLGFVMTFITEVCKVTEDNDDDDDDNTNEKDADKKNESDEEPLLPLEQQKQKQQQDTTTDITLGSIKSAYNLAWSQGLSTFCAWLLPFCPGFKTWSILLTISFILFFFIYHRLYSRKKSFRKSNSRMIAWLSATKNNDNKHPTGTGTGLKMLPAASSAPSIGEQEMYNCKRLSLALLSVCSMLWTSLVVAYMIYSVGPLLFPDNALLHTEGLNMICECFIDVLFKYIYMILIIDVYNSIFDPSGRAKRRLEELQEMMGVVWNNSSDVIGISVRSASGSIRTVVSPTFLRAFSNDDDNNSERFPALAFEIHSSSFIHCHSSNKTDTNSNGVNNSSNNKESYVTICPSDIYGIEFTDGAGGTTSSSSNGGKNDKRINIDSDPVREAITSMAEMVARAWTSNSEEAETLLMHDLTKKEGYTREQIQCEANVTRMEENSLIIVVRDISERFRRFEAEKRIVSETTARLKDEAANRFTKHEVKNGLLAAIGLCDSLREATAAAAMTITANNAVNEKDEFPIKQRASSFSHASNGEIACSSSLSRALALREETRAAFMFELDKTLHEVLDTVMAEAMARDVTHEVYEPKLERVDVPNLLNGTMNTATSDASFKRFPLKCDPKLLPDFALDPQLLKFIHRNAISNACKYGKRGGKVVTEVKWDLGNKCMQINVVNLPGIRHEEILQLGSEKASELIFSPGLRLDVHKNNGNNESKTISSHSAGDGAWIMSKCAKTLKGQCKLNFFSDQTVFSFQFPVVTYNDTNLKAGLYNSKSFSEFELPKNIYGIAIDDSKIQRKLLNRYFGFAGIPKDRIRIYGQNAAEIRGFADVVVQFVDEHPDDYFLLVVDENLDVEEDEDTEFRDCTILGSLLVSSIRKRLLPDQERRILALIRSANDSANDIAIYNSRAHGYLPKSPIKGLVGVKEQLAPLWLSRYNESNTNIENICSENQDDSDGDDEEIAAFVNDLLSSINSLDRLISDNIVPLSTNGANVGAKSNQLLLGQWSSIWDKLHVIKGDLQTINVDGEDKGEMTWVINTITAMRGSMVPPKFDQKWEKLRSALKSSLDSLGMKETKQNKRIEYKLGTP